MKFLQHYHTAVKVIGVCRRICKLLAGD